MPASKFKKLAIFFKQRSTLVFISILVAFLILSFVSKIQQRSAAKRPKNESYLQGSSIELEASINKTSRGKFIKFDFTSSGNLRLDSKRIESVHTPQSKIDEFELTQEAIAIQATSATILPTIIPSPPPLPLEAMLLSSGKPAIADVRGNLGPASVVTDEAIGDWLKDRWQAARNMQGEPIGGEHWIEIDLQRLCLATNFLIDWEQAFSDDWSIIGRADIGAQWMKLASSRSKGLRRSESKQHVVHEVVADIRDKKYNAASSTAVPSTPSMIQQRVRFVRLVIHSSSTRWGPSVWRFQIWGYEA